MLRTKRSLVHSIVHSIVRTTTATFFSLYTTKHFSSSAASNFRRRNKIPSIDEQGNQDVGRQLVFVLQKHPTSDNVIRQIHSHLLTSGYLGEETNGKLLVFNALVRSYSLSESALRALFLYKQLVQSHLFDPYQKASAFDSFTYSFLAKAGANSRETMLGIQVHGVTVKLGFEFHLYVQTALVDMYVVWGNLFDAWKVFDEMPARNSVSWNVMITGLIHWGEIELARTLFEEMPSRTVVSWTGLIDGYTRLNSFDKAIELFREMVVRDEINPNEITLLAIFPAVSGEECLRMCRSIHGYGEKRGFNSSDIRVANALIDAYAKCGCIASAWKFFEEISEERRSIVSWTSVISAFAMHGMGKEAVDHFEKMEKTGLKPNRITFLSVLNACSHGGLVEEGFQLFDKMVKKLKITPDIKHYGCLVDMLGRTGRLEEAEKLALEIPDETTNSVIWRTLLSSCGFHGNLEIGERATRRIMELEKGYGGDYVIMSNIFAGAGRFSDAEKLRRLMDQRNALKVAGRSSVYWRLK